MRFRFLLFLISSIILPAKCFAHVSERALILLLPTEFYIPAGISVLILTILNIPSIIFEILPFIFLLGVMFFFINLFEYGEIEMLRTNGINNIKITIIIS